MELILIEDNQIHYLPETQSLTRMLWHPTKTWDTAKISTTLCATDHIASFHIVAKAVAPTTQLEFAPKWQPLKLPTKPQPWTPIQSFLLEPELNFYPDNVFIKLIGCNICYTGPHLPVR